MQLRATLHEPPVSINVCLVDEETSPANIAAWKELTLVKDRIIIPIVAKRKKNMSSVRPTAIPGSFLCLPSRVKIFGKFPLQPAFAMTVEKAQGRTLEYVILALSHRRGLKCQMDYASIYVSLSRVKNRDRIRLLLTGKTNVDKHASISYCSALTPNKSLSAFWAGYRSQQGTSWQDTVWNRKLAHDYYQSHKFRRGKRS